MTSDIQPPNPAAASAAEDEISLLDVALVLAKRKLIVLGLPFVAAVVSAIMSLLATEIYTGTTKILPPQQSQSNLTVMLGQLGAVGGLLGGSAGLRNPNDVYIAMLSSRTLADKLIERFRLKDLYKQQTLVGTRAQLKNATQISAGKDGVITIDVDDPDPKRAAALANAYVEELEKLTQSLAVTEAGQRRLFFEKQLMAAKDKLAESEVSLRKTQEKTGLIRLDDQGHAIITAVATLRAQVAAKEVQLSAMRSFATGRNPEVVRAEQELEGLRAELAKLERTGRLKQNDIFIPLGKVPEAGLEYVRKMRDVKYHETMFELLAKQYEIARMDEAKDAFLIQVLDKALEPEGRSKPERRKTVVLTALAVGMFSIILAFILEAAERARNNPAHAARLQLLRRYLWGR